MGKPSNCKCPGRGFKEKGDRWVVVNRREGRSSQLKCLECGWKWYSKCRYVALLEDHTEKSRSGMTDNDILNRLKDKSLAVDQATGRVKSFSARYPNGKILREIERESEGSTYQFVEVTHQGMQKKISVHRLVWMSANMRLVPDGFDVNHKRGKRVPNHNGIHNLELMESSRNRAMNAIDDPTQEYLPF